MKKIILFLFFSITLLAQEKEKISLNKSIKDPNSSFKSITIIDHRDSKDVGSVMYHKDQIDLVFESDNADADIKNWFYKYNPAKGKDDFVLLLEDVRVNEDKKEKFSIGNLHFRASTFIKKEDGYHFITRKDTLANVSSRVTPYMAQSLAKKITLIFTDLFKDSYKTRAWEFGISENDLSDYTSVLRDRLDIFKADTLKEGVYKDSYSFFMHKPEPGFVIQTNSKGIVTKAVNGEEKIPLRNMYAFVHQGIPYKVIPVGYTEVFKDDKGLSIEATSADLFPETSTSGVAIGAAAGGLVGGMIGAVVDVSLGAGKRKTNSGSQVYLDPFTGNYILPENFGKSK
ncbi:hypothetical protein VUJ46_15070 [Chryseobacterium sp. MYb264]|uniref:hypothetical protein n=1 Tax=Chryseobacterium sp. MYb264 TaxID=2745153 RepID=UPI002E122751|nr:hypothetical protein VUJ46_15070 [Chryseobacterium sp. MYb264]